MESFEFPISAGQLGIRLGARLIGDETLQVTRLASIAGAPEGALAFFNDRRFATQLDRLKRVVLLTTAELVQPDLPLTYLVVDDPQKAFSSVSRHFRKNRPWFGRSERAFIDPEAQLAPGVSVGPFAVVLRGARIGEGTSVGASAHVGEGVEIGEGCTIHPNVTLMAGVRVGNRVQIFPGTVIGGDGFGLTPTGEGYTEVPHVGTVVIEDDVRIGSNCAVDRATLGETRIGRGTKVDNLVHVAHNVVIGKDCLLCGQSGIAGSSVLEDGAAMGGQSGISAGVHVGKGARLGAGTGVLSNLREGETYLLYPAMPLKKAMSVVKLVRRLPELWQRVKRLEERQGEQA